MTAPAPGRPTTTPRVTGPEVLRESELVIAHGAATASFVINRSTSLGEALNILDAARVCLRAWDGKKAHEGESTTGKGI